MTVSLMFLKLNNAKDKTAVRGDSEDTDHEGLIEIDSWKWELTEDSDSPKGTTRTLGPGMKMVPSQLSFSKGPDRATTRMMSALANGEIFPSAEFTLMERSELEPFHLVIELMDARLVKCDLNVTDDEKQVTLKEDWTITYHHIEFRYADEGKTHEVQLTRPPGADENEKDDKVSSKDKADDMIKNISRLDPKDRARVKNAFG